MSGELKSGDICKCSHCGYQGPCYGVPFIGGNACGVSAPFCPRCQLNDNLFKVEAA